MDFTPTFHLDTYDAISPSLPSLSTKGKSVLITGGGVGIGSFAARSFCLSGCSRLALTGRTESTLNATVLSLQTEFPDTHVQSYVTDVTDATAIAAVFKDFGAPDVLVNNAGIFVGEKKLKDIDIEEWWKNMETNVKGVAIVTQQFLRKKEESKGGVVIMINSPACHWGKVPGWTHYTASKAALLRLSEILQFEHPELRIINLSPGFVQTAMIEQVKDPGLKSMPRSSPELVGNFINWAASSEAEFLAGRFAWMQWDVEELKTREEEILEKDLLLYTIKGI